MTHYLQVYLITSYFILKNENLNSNFDATKWFFLSFKMGLVGSMGRLSTIEMDAYDSGSTDGGVARDAINGKK